MRPWKSRTPYCFTSLAIRDLKLENTSGHFLDTIGHSGGSAEVISAQKIPVKGLMTTQLQKCHHFFLFYWSLHKFSWQPQLTHPTSPFSIFVLWPSSHVCHTAFGPYCKWWRPGLHCLPIVQHVKCVFVWKNVLSDSFTLHFGCNDKGKEKTHNVNGNTWPCIRFEMCF